MLYHPENCSCQCHRKDGFCIDCFCEDGVVPIGKIDWYDPIHYGWLCNINVEGAQQYRNRWEKAYTARGWQSPF